MELKPEHHNPAFYDTTHVSHEAAVDDDEDDDLEEYEDDDSNSMPSNQSSSHILDTSGISHTTGSNTAPTSSILLMNPAAIAATNTGNENKVRKTKKSYSVKKPQSPAPPIATRKATSYIGVSGS